MTGRLLYLGATHRTAPLPVRERLRADTQVQVRLLNCLAAAAAERLVVSTCERFEIYAWCDGDVTPEWHTALAGVLGADRALLEEHLHAFEGVAVAEHLLRVAAGLESRIVGEPHILGQVRRAFLLAGTAGATGPVLSALGRAAIHTGKRVRRETPINVEARSIASITADRIEEDFGLLQDRTVLILGTGRLALDVAVHLAARRAAIVVSSRSAERAAELALKVRGEAVGLADLRGVLQRVDAVVACTSAGSYLIDPRTLASRTSGRLRLWDLSVPRAIDPTVAGLPDITLEHLEGLVGSGCAPRQLHMGVAAAQRVVAEELERFARWLRERPAAPLIQELLRSGDGMDTAADGADRQSLHRRIMKLKLGVAA
ncbi:MAG: glutamyl-tRNA reductase [Planctomycetes bacterium]|nr:glutamyl-tRNA reductase [Planctomycetota bacterium]